MFVVVVVVVVVWHLKNIVLHIPRLEILNKF
jgi:hypothetical protein